MYFNVHVKPSGYNIAVKAGETVLDAALRQGFQFPHECMSGICGTCRGQILEGRVDYEELPLALSDEERETGKALFCAAIPSTDLIIQIENVIGPERLPVKKLLYSVENFTQLTQSICRVILQPPAEDCIDYHPGQYIEILHRDTNPKPFSIANGNLLAGNQIELHIRHWPNSPYTQELIDDIQVIGKLKLRGPLGACILHREPPHPMIFIAGGAGIAPHKALIEQALAEKISIPIYLYWGVRTPEDWYLEELIKDWIKSSPNFHYIPVLSAPNDQWQGRTGLVHEAVLQDHSDLSQFHIYASGPTEMVYAALHAFQNHGLNRHQMYSDAFDYSVV